MDVFLAIRVFLLLCIACVCSAEDYLANTMLSGFKMYSRETANQYQCVTLCMKAEYCLSVNFNPVSRVCELNNHKRDGGNPGHPMKNYMYIAPIKSEGSSQCGEQCLENELCTSLDSRTTACLPIDGDEFTATSTTVSGGESDEESIATTRASSESDEEPTTTTRASSLSGEEPTTTTGAPGESDEEPTTTTRASTSGTACKTLGITVSKPKNKTTSMITRRNGLSGEEPTTTTGAPGESGEEPTTTTRASSLSGEEPTTTTGAPGESDEEPTTTTRASSLSGEEPTTTTGAPGESDEESIATTRASSLSGEESTTTTGAPVENGEELIVFTGAPDAVSTEITTIAQDIELEAENITLYNGKVNWDEANAFCRSKNKTLLSMKTLRKAQALSSKLLPENITAEPYVWSALRRNENGEFNWADCSPLGSLTFWNQSVDLEASRDECVKIHIESLEWFPSACINQNFVVCEEQLDSCWFKRYRDAFDMSSSSSEVLSEASREDCRRFCLKEISQGEECIAFTHDGQYCFLTMGNNLEELPMVRCSYGHTIDVKQCFLYKFDLQEVEKDIPGPFPLCLNKTEPPGHFELAGEFVHSTCSQEEQPMEIPFQK